MELSVFLTLVAVVFIIYLFASLIFRSTRGPLVSEKRTEEKGQGEAAFVVGAFQEIIAKLKQKEIELERLRRSESARADESQRFSEEIVLSIESPLITVAADGKITSFNPAAERLFGVEARRALGSDYSSLLAASPRLVALIGDCLLRSTTHKRAEVQLSAEGRTRHLGVTISPIRTAGGALCLISDLTEVVELQERIKLKENLAALGEMMAGIAHEFKNSLATISGYAQLLSKEEHPATRESAAALLSEVKVLGQIVSNFLDFVRPSRLNLEDVDLSELVASCVRDIENDPVFSHVQIVTDSDFPRVKGDRLLLRQALANLLRNAAEAIEPASAERSIYISSRIDEMAGVKNAIISIEDTGKGVPATELEKIFLPFYTTKSQGTGLGLALAQKIAVSHNGKIIARPRAGRGMVFMLCLPIEPIHQVES